MHDIFISYIRIQLGISLDDSEVELLKKSFTIRKVRKRQYFLQAGEVCRVAGFVAQGALKTYSVDEHGKENILSLAIENWWVGDRESFQNETPTPYNIEAVEDSVILSISKNEFVEKLISKPFFLELQRVLTERQALQLLKRLHSTKTLTSEQRLAELEKNYPEMLQRFPQHLIASYLGMTKETLSRIRSNTSRK
jgi:CRP-like cAMP-binding protein